MRYDNILIEAMSTGAPAPGSIAEWFQLHAGTGPHIDNLVRIIGGYKFRVAVLGRIEAIALEAKVPRRELLTCFLLQAVLVLRKLIVDKAVANSRPPGFSTL